MVKYDVVVLFKNGVEKVFKDIVSCEDGAKYILREIQENYKLGILGVINLGLSEVRVDETVCIELVNLCETDSADEMWELKNEINKSNKDNMVKGSDSKVIQRALDAALICMKEEKNNESIEDFIMVKGDDGKFHRVRKEEKNNE